jgi:hypothetical protein
MKGRGRAAVLSQSLSLYRVPTCGIEVGWQRNIGPKGLALNSLYIFLYLNVENIFSIVFNGIL